MKSTRLCLSGLLVSVLLLTHGYPAPAQTFDSGSDGSDGALSLTAAGDVQFDPTALGLDPDGDHIFHFTTITIGPDTRVILSAEHLQGPVFWLASGAVDIQGVLDLNGASGLGNEEMQDNAPMPAQPGAGGYPGGIGKADGTTDTFALPGQGPGGGTPAPSRNGGTHDYGSRYCVPLIGGSGGAGYSSGGGAGGGALLIAGSSTVTVSGTIRATGGAGGYARAAYGAGGGSGGELRLVATELVVSGRMECAGGAGGGSNWAGAGGKAGATGRIRLEGFTKTMTGSSFSPAPAYGTPYNLFLPDGPPSLVRVIRVGGVEITNPGASFVTPDAVIDSADPVDIVIEADNVPLTAVVTLYLLPETGAQQALVAPALHATNYARSETTVTVTLPSGYTRGFVTADWSTP